MKLLVIGTDKTILEKGSVANTRQVEYYKNFESAKVVLLCPGEKVDFKIGSVQFLSFGGANRLVCFIKTFIDLYFSTEKFEGIYTQDVLYTGLLGLLLRRKKNSKLITQIHGDYLDNPLWIRQRFENRILNYIGKEVAKKSFRIRAVSNRIVRYLEQTLNIPKGVAISLPIGVDGEVFNKESLPTKREKVLVFVGRLMGEKEPHFFCDIVIPILKKYPEFKAVMIGEGSLKDELKKRFEEVSLTERVSFPGFLKFSEIAKYYKSSFLFIHSAFWEGWGLPMVESTCCGLPNITTDTGCAGEVVINNYNGIILNSKNASDYTNEIEKLIHDEAKYNLLVENCLKSGDEWTFKTMARKTETFLLLAQNKI